MAISDYSKVKNESGVVILKETTTPSDVADYGQIYTKNDNHLYFKDGDGVEKSVTNIANPFVEVSSVIKQGDSPSYTEDFVFGSPQLDDDGDAGHDDRMFFDKSKRAFRMGGVASTQWNDANRGDYSVGLGYNTIASGNYSIAFGASNESKSTHTTILNGLLNVGETGEYITIINGRNNYCDKDYGTIISGASNYNVGIKSTVINGDNHEIYGDYSVIINGHHNILNADYSIVQGIYAISNLYGQNVFGIGKFATAGDAQRFNIVVRADTTDATPEVMYIDNSNTNKLVLPEKTSWRFEGRIVATVENSTSMSSFLIKGGIRRDNANNTTITAFNSVTTELDEIGVGGVTMTADDTNEALNINITGKALTNILWVGDIIVSSVSY